MSIEQLFLDDGPLARALPGFEARPGQVEMAQRIERGMLEGGHTIAEAGTGVGKSLAYLIPALRSGKRVVLSTGTIALQEQLVQKDIPLVQRALDTPVRVTLLKGRGHYLCRQKFERMRTGRLVASSRSMQRIWEWAMRTREGDRAELPFIPSGDEWEQVNADADDCVGEFCERYRECHFFKKRDEAKYADIVVVNHALFFLDLVVGGGLLPAYDVAVLDEAHQAERWATDALTLTISRESITRMLRKLHRSYRVPAEVSGTLEEGMRGLEAALARVPGERYPLQANEGATPELDRVREALFGLENWVHANWQDALKVRSENDAESERRRDLALRAISAHLTTLERAQAGSEDAATWVQRGERDGRYEVNHAPYDVAAFLRAHLFERTPVVLTSATMSTADGSFDFFKRSLGIEQAEELIAPSPFDYARQARFYVAPPSANPKARDFAHRVAPIIEETLDRTHGRAFVLFTSHARLREVHALLHGRIAFPTKLQGDLPRARLLEWFRRTPNAVLFATATFWEGIDVVGEALSCVIIDRLPFPSPSDPLVQGRMRELEARGLDAFQEYMIPAATVRLKQGFGRLIRSMNDRGVMVLLDGRAASNGYGATILAALPAATRIDHLDQLTEFFA